MVRVETVGVVAEVGALVVEQARFEAVGRLGVQPGCDLIEVDARRFRAFGGRTSSVKCDKLGVGGRRGIEGEVYLSPEIPGEGLEGGEEVVGDESMISEVLCASADLLDAERIMNCILSNVGSVLPASGVVNVSKSQRRAIAEKSSPWPTFDRFGTLQLRRKPFFRHNAQHAGVGRHV